MLRLQPRIDDGGIDSRHQAGVGDVVRRHIDMHVQVGERLVAQLPFLELAAGAAQHEVGQRDDQARLFGDRDEGQRADGAQFRVVPARQRLEAGDAARGHVEQRLVGHRQLPGGQRAPQVAFEPQAMRDLGVQRRVEQREPRLAAGLGLVHRGVGVAQHVGRRAVADAAEGDADAGAGGDLGAGDLERLAQHLEQPVGQGHCVAIAVNIFGQDREFVAAQPRHDVVRAHMLANALRNRDQELVAHGVAKAVVDELEAVEVEKHQAEVPLRAGLEQLDGGA